jgi:hypothetical protein
MFSFCGMAFSAMLSLVGQGCFLQSGNCVLQEGQWVPVQSAGPARPLVPATAPGVAK